MKSLAKILGLILGVVVIFIIHLVVINLFPYPFNHVNTVFLCLLWLVIFSGQTKILWLALPLAFLLELFSPVPFGVITLALIISLSVISWFLFNIFTNRSPYIVFLSAFLGLLLYRLLFALILYLLNLFKGGYPLLLPEILFNIFLEIILTSGVLTFGYWLTTLFIRRLNPAYIRLGKR